MFRIYVISISDLAKKRLSLPRPNKRTSAPKVYGTVQTASARNAPQVGGLLWNGSRFPLNMNAISTERRDHGSD